MKTKLKLILICFFTNSFVVSAKDNCAKDWQVDLSTNPSESKLMSGDTHAAYAVYAFRGQRGLSLSMQGKKIAATRFFSIQNYWSRLLLSRSERLQFEEENSLLIDSDLKQNFEIELSTRRNFSGFLDDKPEASISKHFFGIRNIGVQAIMLRIYAPHQKITKENLPNIYAYLDGKPTNCPKPFNVNMSLNFPQFIGRLAPKHEVLEFGPSGLASGANKAIPKYVVSLAEIPEDRFTVIWLKAPTKNDVRYWSLCSNNFLKNETLNCIADQDAIIQDPNERLVGFIFGSEKIYQKTLKDCAKKLNLNYFEDKRERRQRIAGFVYRNILPSDDFRENGLYQEEFLPLGFVFKQKEFICDINYLKSFLN